MNFANQSKQKTRFIWMLFCGLLVIDPAVAGDEAASSNANFRGYVEMNGCKPIWPKASLRNGETGVVALAFLVNAEGTVVDSKVTRSSSFRDLDNAAHVGLKNCKFHPAIENGKPIESWVKLQYQWQLE